MAAHRIRAPYRLRDRMLRTTGGLVMLGTAFALMWWQQQVRGAEIDVADHWFGLFLTGDVQAVDDTIYFAWTGGPMIGLRNTWECTVALLASPLCAIGGALLTFTRMPWHRLLIGLCVALGTVVGVNQLRLGLIAVSLQHWGWTGYDISHKFVGSLFAIAGFAVAVMLFIKIASRSKRQGRLATDA